VCTLENGRCRTDWRACETGCCRHDPESQLDTILYTESAKNAVIRLVAQLVVIFKCSITTWTTVLACLAWQKHTTGNIIVKRSGLNSKLYIYLTLRGHVLAALDYADVTSDMRSHPGVDVLPFVAGQIEYERLKLLLPRRVPVKASYNSNTYKYIRSVYFTGRSVYLRTINQ
jgi:hypothetical protein